MFPRLYYHDSRLFKSRERGDGRYAGEPRLRFCLRFPPPKLALGRLQPAFAGPRSRRRPRVGTRSAASQEPGPVSTTFRVVTFLVFAHLPPPFRFCASGLLPGCCRAALLHSSSVYYRKRAEPQLDLPGLFRKNSAVLALRLDGAVIVIRLYSLIKSSSRFCISKSSSDEVGTSNFF